MRDALASPAPTVLCTWTCWVEYHRTVVSGDLVNRSETHCLNCGAPLGQPQETTSPRS